MGIDWNATEERAAAMTAERLQGAIDDCLATLTHSDAIDRAQGTDQGGKYRDEISVYRRELAGRPICPECPKHGAGFPIVLDVDEHGATCPNCSRWWAEKSGTKDAQPRDRAGRYADSLAHLCVCGHRKGEHTAERAVVDGEPCQPCIDSPEPCECEVYTRRR